MIRRRLLLSAIVVWILQYAGSEYLVIRQVRPDFLLIFILYAGVWEGSLIGVVAGFSLGLLEDLTGTDAFFGLSPLAKSLAGFFAGTLRDWVARYGPIAFHAGWIAILILHFLLVMFVRNQTLLDAAAPEFLVAWTFLSCYTLVIAGILQWVVPIHRRAER